jgi:S1-C subfamily serine protease
MTFFMRLVLVFVCTVSATLPIRAQTADAFLSKYKRAVVKLTVTGKDPRGNLKRPIAGSGFVIYSGLHNSLILTAAHVVGSSDRRPILNPDWSIGPDGRTLDRTINIEILDERGVLTSLGQDSSVLWQDDQKDIALLLIDRTGLPSIPYAQQTSDVQGEFIDSLALGFPKDERRLSSRRASGNLQSSRQYGLVFRLHTRLREGMSGGPVIDLTTGKAIAAASEDIASFDEHYAAPLFPAIPSIAPYVTHANAVAGPDAAEDQIKDKAGQAVTGNCNTAIQGVSGSNITISGDRTCQ